MATVHAFDKYLLSNDHIQISVVSWEYKYEHKHGSSLLIPNIWFNCPSNIYILSDHKAWAWGKLWLRVRVLELNPGDKSEPWFHTS